MAYHSDTFQHHKGWRENRAIGDRIVFHKFRQLHSLLKEYYYKPYVCAYDMLPAWKNQNQSMLLPSILLVNWSFIGIILTFYLIGPNPPGNELQLQLWANLLKSQCTLGTTITQNTSGACYLNIQHSILWHKEYYYTIHYNRACKAQLSIWGLQGTINPTIHCWQFT